MNLQSFVAIAGMLIGTTLMFWGRRERSPRELRIVGGFILVASFCYLLGLQLPNIW